MIYQFPDHILPYAIFIDLILLGMQWLSARPVQRSHQRITFGLCVLGFIAFSLFKVLFSVPHSIASTPVDLKIRSNDTFTTFYYLGKSYVDDTPKVFWKEHIIGKEKFRYFDVENRLEKGLIIACKFEGNWYSKAIQWQDEKTNELIIEKENFEPANLDVIDAIEYYFWTAFGNYFSNFLTLLFLIVAIRKVKMLK